VSDSGLYSLQEQVRATLGRAKQLVRSIEGQLGVQSAATAKVKAALAALVELDEELTQM
jgi:hypothetical protein